MKEFEKIKINFKLIDLIESIGKLEKLFDDLTSRSFNVNHFDLMKKQTEKILSNALQLKDEFITANSC